MLAFAAPLVGFAGGYALKGKPFFRGNRRSLAIYYCAVLASYGVVYAALFLGATEQDAIVSRPQSLGCFGLVLGPFVGVWFVAAALGMPKIVDPDVCRKCGYNLTGNVSGVCPECGACT